MITTIIQKMNSQLLTNSIQYTLKTQADNFDLNAKIGQNIQIHFTGRIFCDCGKQVKKLFQGFCYDCFRQSPEAAECIIRPEVCEAHLNKGRDVQWELDHHFQPHIVYLAASSSIKVGVTRATQMPTRWIDQGASAALVFAEVPYRRLAGEIEVLLKAFVTDKTAWQKMLKNDVVDPEDMYDVRERLMNELPVELQKYTTLETNIQYFNYPVLEYPTKLTSLKLDTTPQIESKLFGIKGQYLLLENGKVFNMRAHEGYEIQIN